MLGEAAPDKPGLAGLQFTQRDRVQLTAITSRDVDQIFAILDLPEQSETVRSYAWTALSHSRGVQAQELLERVVKDDSPAAWEAMSFHRLSDPLRVTLRDRWQTNSRAGICRVLAGQGNLEDARWLMSTLRTHAPTPTGDGDADGTGSAGSPGWPGSAGSAGSAESEGSAGSAESAESLPEGCAYAVGAILHRSDATQQDLLDVSEWVMHLAGERIGGSERRTEDLRGLLYVFSRSERHRPDYTTREGGEIAGRLMDAWKRHGIGSDPLMDAWMVRSLGIPGSEEVTRRLGRSAFNGETVRAVEVARTAFRGGFATPQQELITANLLLSHPNPIVGVVYMDGVAARAAASGIPDTLLLAAIQRHGATTTDDETWLSALSVRLASKDPDERSDLITPHLERIRALTSTTPYLIERALPLIAEASDSRQMLDTYAEWIRRRGLSGLFAVRDLNRFWISQKQAHIAPSSSVDPVIRSAVRDLAQGVLESGDRSMAYSVEPLLMDDELFPPTRQELEWVLEAMGSYSLPADIEVFQAVGRVLEERWPSAKETRLFLDSFQAPSNPPGFRQPDWDRLERLGPSPHLILETPKGEIVIRMDPARAPFTVSAIDSLAGSGAYDGVPFHRLAHNFVIQGGDVESGDGFGGPEFIIPTEGAVGRFKRGAAGIASAGPDTEGSQYFVMLDWAPHLDGRYTLFGTVVHGMQVADRIRIGDPVLRARVQPAQM